MLTIKAPIQLHIAQGLTGNADAFGERIRGNYGMMGARYTPKDLLFLLIAPPDLPEETGGMTTLVTQQSNVDVRTVTMDVVNNVVNRIMLDGTPQFTYQDQVYITSVLNRLGITNVEQFMEQIRQLRTENENTVQLTKLYRSELERVIQQQAAGEEAPSLPIVPARREEEQVAHSDPRVSMSLNILNRLDTAKLYETVHNFQRNWTWSSNSFQNNEFRLAEQLRFSNSVSLAQIKQQIYEQPQLNLLHHLNRYETSLMLEAPENEEAVLSQAAAAALINAVDNTVTEVLNRPQLRKEQWVNIENAVYQSAENALTRFEHYHNQFMLPASQTQPDAQAAWNHYAQELQEYRAFYQQVYPKAAEHGRVIGLPEVTHRELLRLTNVEEGEEIRQILESSTQLTQDQRQTLLQAILLTQQGGVGQNLLREIRTTHRREEHSHETERQTRRERWKQVLQARRGEDVGKGEKMPEPSGREVLRVPEITPVKLTDREIAVEGDSFTTEQLEYIDQTNRTLLQDVRQEIHTTRTAQVNQEMSVPSAAAEGDEETAAPLIREVQRVEETLQRLRSEGREEQSSPVVSPVTMTALEAEEQAPEVLVEQIQRIEEHNRTLLQNLQQPREREVVMPGAPDLRRTMRDALRALEEPEQVLREIYTQRETTMVHPRFTPEEEEILNRVDPANRGVYEQILAYQKDPEGTLAKGILRQASMGAFQAEIQRVMQETQPEPEFEPMDLEQQITFVREQSETVLERFYQKQPQFLREEIRQPEAVKIVHKEASPQVSEELMEQLEQQRTQNTVKTVSNEEITRSQTHQVDLNQVEHKIVTQTTQDITELVNKTLARQMRTISDQVYRQMEKRLQTERSRRGRF